MATATPTYMPLGNSSSHIRLLEVSDRKSSKRPRLTCRMRTVHLHDAPPFVALSYVWGDTDERGNIVLNGQLVSITKNLEGALRGASKLQQAFPDLDKVDEYLLWADALCIDQANTSERSAQIKLMAKLYQRAVGVIAWLGLEDEDLAFRALHTMLPKSNRFCAQYDPEGPLLAELASLRWLVTSGHPELCENDKLINLPFLFNACWSAIVDPLSREYWKRVWIFQETILARRLILACPTSAMVFDDLGTFARIMENVQAYHKMLGVAKPEYIGSAVWYFLTDIIGWMPVVNIMRERAAREVDGGLPNERARRCALSTFGFSLGASDPRDHVYGLLAVTDMDIEPDYDKSLGQVYADFSSAWIKACHSSILNPEMLFLSYAGIGVFGEEPSLPSWVPNFSACSQMKSTMDHGWADNDMFAPSVSGASVNMADMSLIVSGVEVDVVALVHEIPGAEEIELHVSEMVEVMKKVRSVFMEKVSPTRTTKPQGSTAAGERKSISAQDTKPGIREAYPPAGDFSSLVGPPHAPGSHGPYHYAGSELSQNICDVWPRSEAENLQDLGFALDDTFDITFHKKMFPVNDNLLNQISAFKGNLLRELREFEPIGGIAELLELQTRIGELTRSWRLIETEKGHLGLAPKGSKLGDVVTVLKGSRVPVILRERGDHFVHVGTSFILDLTDGELSGCVEAGKFSIKEFRIL
ncbi:heterokaryon incompatibility protein-domain-containing protein [Diplogelasinospora grovesii]|uniref:Heterokaryon incompatibility protein-domain-containing protein n=1 Tax=Diplogelasinospora grovesii TaxID=303347 RepID=A0AAN6S149_9PEZI|nr:heterokaryon incompatibility protein-domain-containing protein [Diplogelasinospora grovesii]